MGKKPDDDMDFRSTISDDDWQGLRDRANKANPEQSDLGDPEGMRRRKMANDNFHNRENN